MIVKPSKDIKVLFGLTFLKQKILYKLHKLWEWALQDLLRKGIEEGKEILSYPHEGYLGNFADL